MALVVQPLSMARQQQQQRVVLVATASRLEEAGASVLTPTRDPPKKKTEAAAAPKKRTKKKRTAPNVIKNAEDEVAAKEFLPPASNTKSERRSTKTTTTTPADTKKRILNSGEQIKLALCAQDLLKWEREREKLSKRLERKPTEEEWLVAANFTGSVASFSKARRKSRAAKAAMMTANLGLVWAIARRYQWKGLALEDLIQEGTFGLAKAVDKFDTERGITFSTYATWWIKQAVAAAVMDQGRAIRLPSNVNKQVSQLSAATRRIVSALGREPSSVELEATLNVTDDRVATLKTLAKSNVFSYDVNLGESRTYAEGIIDHKLLTEDEAAGLRHDLTETLELVLNEREISSLRLRFGLDDGKQRSIREVAEILDISKESTRLLQIKALEKLKSTKRGEALLSYMNVGPQR